MNFSFPDLSATHQKSPQVTATKTSPLDERIEVFVLWHKRKTSTTIKTLLSHHIPFIPYENPDWEFPEDHPELQVDRAARPTVREYALRQYRAFKGHQAILAQADPAKLTLVFEDDMSFATTPEEVFAQLNMVTRLLTGDSPLYDAVSFHGRNQSPPVRSCALLGREYVELGPRELKGQEDWGHNFFLKPVMNSLPKYQNRQFRWHEGCLAYMVGPAGRAKWVAAGHGHGMPCDLFLVNELNTIVMRDTIFLHDERHGSLISNTVKQAVP